MKKMFYKRLVGCLCVFNFILGSSSLLAVSDEKDVADHFSILSSELESSGLARVYLHRDNSFVKPEKMKEADIGYFDFAVVGSQMKFNVMKFDAGGLVPFAQLIASKSAIRAVYVDVAPGELRLLVQMLNVANFGVRQGFVDEIKLNVEAGKVYHLAVGLESFRGFETYSGFAIAQLPKDKFNKCLNLKKRNFDNKKILEITQTHEEILSCAGLLEGLEQGVVKKKFTKWVSKNEESMLESLKMRRKNDSKREIRRAKKEAKKVEREAKKDTYK